MPKPGPPPRSSAARRAGIDTRRQGAPPSAPPGLRRLAADTPPPRWLDAAARRRWREVVPLLAEAGTVSAADTAILARYCDAWSRWLRLAKFLRTHGETHDLEFAGGHRRPAIRPETKLCESALRECRALEVELGLTPASRTRVSALPDDSAGASVVARLRQYRGGRDGVG